jgi:hypothetical protein
MAKLNINGSVRDVEVESDTPLLWVIREQIGLTGTKYGCGVAQCGACSVHINDQVQRSCSIRVGDVQATDRIVTIEGLSASSSHPCRKPGRRSTCRNAATASPARSGRRCAAEEDSKTDGQGYRRGDDQYLSLRHLPAHPDGRAWPPPTRRKVEEVRHE